MKRFRFLLFVVFLILYHSANAQKIDLSEIKNSLLYQGTYRPLTSQAGHCMLDKPQIIDTCRLQLSYIADILVDTLQKKHTRDICVVEIGNTYMKYYGWVCWRYNMNATLFSLNRNQEQVSVNAIYQPVVDYAIFRDLRNRILTNRHLLPLMNHIVYEYEEELPEFEWEITSDTLTIAGYLCYRARTRYAARHWTVWFSPQIAIDCGLWKFNGLPGAIMQAQDQQMHYFFQIQAIKQTNTSVIKYDIPTKRVDQQTYKRIEEKRYRHPFSGASDEFYIVPNPSTRQPEFLPNDWTIPYNPIELE